MSVFFKLANLVVGVTLISVARADQSFNGSEFPKPLRLLFPLMTPSKEVIPLVIPNPYPRANIAMQGPFIHALRPEADPLFEDVRIGIQYVFQTKSNWTLALHGTGTTGLHAILDNLLEPGDKVVVLVLGHWGQVMANISERIGAEVIQVTRPIGSKLTLKEIEDELKLHRPKALALVGIESSTGVSQPVEGVGHLCEKYKVLLICDMVAVAGIQPILMDRNKIDAVAANSHTGLGGVVGLAPVAFSEKVVAKIKSRKVPPRAYQTDMMFNMYLWNISDPARGRKQSLSVPLLSALRGGLAALVEEGLDVVYKRHESTSKRLREGLEALGLRDVVSEPEDRSAGTVTVYPPPGTDPFKIVALMYSKHNVEMSPGVGPTLGKILMFSIVGSSAEKNKIESIISALKDVLSSPEINN